MSYIGNQPTTAHFVHDILSGDGTTTSFGLTEPAGSASAVLVHVGGLYQTPGSGYIVDGTTITFTSAPPTGTNNIQVIHLGIPVQVPVPADGSVTNDKISSDLSLIRSGTITDTSTGETSYDLSTSIPSWAKRITILLDGVGTNGTSYPMFQIGDSGGFETTGYESSSGIIAGVSPNSTTATTGFINISGVANASLNGRATIELFDISTNTWVYSATFGRTSTTAGIYGGGSKSLTGILDRVRITTIGGTNTFNAGKISFNYE